MKNIALSAVIACLAVPAGADTFGPFSDVLIFGDSLSDPGNKYALTGGASPSPIFYPEQQFTNGDTWATQLGYGFESGTNFAYGDATIVTNGDGLPDFEAQRNLYYDSVVDLGDNPLTVVFLGGNDLKIVDFTQPQDVLLAELSVIANTLVTGVQELAETGLDDFLIFGAPDFGKLPAFVGTALEGGATTLSSTYNMVLQSALTALDASHPDVVYSYFATDEFLNDILKNSDALGFTETEKACLVPTSQTTVDFCGFDAAGSFVFFDALHPTEGVHSVLASTLKADLTAVPLPAGAPLLLAALGALGVASRRRVAARTH